MLDVDTVVKMIASDNSFTCPSCGHTFDLSDCDVVNVVVSYWGEDPHEFSCEECDTDFFVREIVTRKFETAKTLADLNAI